jgi:mRNA interferase MazF
MKRGEVWWANAGDAASFGARISAPGANSAIRCLNQGAIHTVIAAAIISNLRLAAAPGSVILRKREGRLDKDSVINQSG